MRLSSCHNHKAITVTLHKDPATFLQAEGTSGEFLGYHGYATSSVLPTNILSATVL
jgi:hypothetical protein